MRTKVVLVLRIVLTAAAAKAIAVGGRVAVADADVAGAWGAQLLRGHNR